MDINIDRFVEIVKKASGIILDVYRRDFDVEYKEDKSPLTVADKRSNAFIVDALKKLYPDIPIIAEEDSQIPYEKRKGWEYFWLVDPLDGTEEFVGKNGEFTINIALIHHKVPIFGIIHSPVKDITYYGIKKKGAFRLKEGRIENLPLFKRDPELLKVIVSRSHYTDETKEFVNKLKEKYGKIKLINIGSALKLCLLAEGSADIYPRFAPTMEWDIAAGHAIISEIGGEVLEYPSLKPIEYNKESLVNPWFIAQRGGIKL